MKKILFILMILCIAPPVMAQEVNWDKLVQAVIMIESGGRLHVVSPAGAIGLMQITSQGALAEWNQQHDTFSSPDHWYVGEDYNMGDLYNPSINVEIGTWYLKRLYHHYKCDTIEKILMSYNGGVTRAKRNGFDLKKMPRETKNYVRRVMELYYKELLWLSPTKQ